MRSKRTISIVQPAPTAAEPPHGLAPGCWSLTTRVELQALEPAWRELSADVAWASPFHTWEFAWPWFESFVLGRAGGANGNFYILVAVDERRQLIGIAPMFEEHALGQSHLGLTLQLLGRSHSMETMTDEPIVLLRRRTEGRAFAMLLEFLSSQVRARGWDATALPRADGSASGPTGPSSLSLHRDRARLTRVIEGPLALELPNSFGTFKAGLSKSMRDNLSYYPRLMSREQGDWSVDLVRCPHDIGLATEQLIALHRERSEWSRGPRHQDHIPGPREAFFVSRWFQRLSLRGEVTLGRLFIRGELAAVQAFVERAGSLNVYYSGQAERWRRYSPLTIVIAEALRDAVRRGVRRLVFPPGSDPWGPLRSTPVHETSVYSTSLPSLVRGVLRRAHLSTGTLGSGPGGLRS